MRCVLLFRCAFLIKSIGKRSNIGSKEGFLKPSFKYNYKLRDRLFIRRQRNIVNSLIVRAIPSYPIVNLIARLLTRKTRRIKEQISEEASFQNLFSIFPFYFFFLFSFLFSYPLFDSLEAKIAIVDRKGTINST